VSRKRSIFSALAIQAGLPARGAARWATIAFMGVGGVVALLVPVFLAVMLWYYLFGEPPPAPPPH
jgi:hypothetical protein